MKKFNMLFKKVLKKVQTKIGVKEITFGIVGIVGIYFLLKQKKIENMTSYRKIVFYKPKLVEGDSPLNHHINISKIELYDQNDEKINLIPGEFSSTWKTAESLKDALDGNKDTFIHSGYKNTHIYTEGINSFANMASERKYMTYLFPADTFVKRIHVTNREKQEPRLIGMRMTIYEDVDRNVDEVIGNLYNHVFTKEEAMTGIINKDVNLEPRVDKDDEPEIIEEEVEEVEEVVKEEKKSNKYIYIGIGVFLLVGIAIAVNLKK